MSELVDKKTTDEAWNYCYKVLKHRQEVPQDHMSREKFAILAREYFSVHEQLYAVGGGIMTCKALLELFSKAKTQDQKDALCEAVNDKLCEVYEITDKLIGD